MPLQSTFNKETSLTFIHYRVIRQQGIPMTQNSLDFDTAILTLPYRDWSVF